LLCKDPRYANTVLGIGVLFNSSLKLAAE
jgi:hypothetical protein